MDLLSSLTFVFISRILETHTSYAPRKHARKLGQGVTREGKGPSGVEGVSEEVQTWLQATIFQPSIGLDVGAI